MAAKNLHIPDDLLAELQAKAHTEGKSVEEMAEQAIREGLKERAWEDLLAYGRERGHASGVGETDVPAVVKQWCREQRGR